jgi:hypothetical protein
LIRRDIKLCFKCGGDPKPLSDFYAHPMMADGRLNKCKECTKKDVKQRYYLVHEERCAYERERWDRPSRRAQALSAQRRRRKRNPEKQAARNAVAHAIRDGRMSRRPCQSCGTTKKVQAHHNDYSKPLDVEWLCFRCHREVAHGQVTAELRKDDRWTLQKD